MKQLLVLSGKGGTGKTTVASAFIRLAKALAYADCDVDAPNLHLVMDQKTKPQRRDFMGLGKALIDQDTCIKCGLCKDYCQFNAIHQNDIFTVDPYACEGCGVCEYFCPVKAITMVDDLAGELLLYQNEAIFSTATLKMGSGTSGLLVSDVKKQMRQAVINEDLAIIDGSPGIGCPVIASLSGVDLVLIVTEPSISGISDLERIVKTAQTFHTKVVVCVNKADTNMINTGKIKAYCDNSGIPFAGTIPYDQCAVTAINEGKTIVDMECQSGLAVRQVFNKVMSQLDQKK